MTDKEEQTENNDITPAESELDDSKQQVHTDDLDIEGALAAIASLQDLTREAEPEIEDEDTASDDDEDDSLDIQEFERVESDEEVEPEPIPEAEPVTDYGTFPRPPVSTLHRGQLASVVPALLLIGIGGYLTFIVTTSETGFNPALIAAVLVGGIGAMLLAQWISTSRWAIGSFFIGVLLLLTGGTAAYLVIPNNLNLTDGYPLLITAVGTAFVITDIFVPSGRRIWLIGLILAIAGLAGVATTTTILDTGIAQTLGGLLPVAIIIIVVLLIAPILRRQQ